MFKTGEYIVCLEGDFLIGSYNSSIGKKNYCVKQARDSKHLDICTSVDGSYSKSNNMFTYDKLHNLTDWRYATEEEAEEYERLGKPYDVTTLKQFVLPEYWCVKDTADERSNELYEYATKNGAIPPYEAGKFPIYYHFPKHDGCTTSDSVIEDYIEITYSQFLKYVLNKEPIKDDLTSLKNLLEKIGIT